MPSLTLEEIIDDHTLTFDPGDKLNGSLYIGEPLSMEPDSLIENLIDIMRGENYWSQEPSRTVLDEHRQAYKDQLILVDSVTYENRQFIIARCDHPRFPSSKIRWNEWKSFFDQRFSRDK